ncbi:putative membrane protein [Paraburkholderia sp. GAS199]|uniref:DUF2339 domain-containing protein n=1 Tax=Paraburkholderia sp. GAS199 TaxID=3035126 RepID=UPI003D1EA02B
MRVLFTLLGAVLGMVAALSNDFPVGIGAVAGAVAGFALVRYLRRKPDASAPTVQREPGAVDGAGAPKPSADLSVRVAWLEREIVALREEIRLMRSGVAGPAAAASENAQADAPIGAGTVAAPEHYAIAPQAAESAHQTDAVPRMPVSPSAHEPDLPAQPIAPRGPNIGQRLYQAARDWLVGGNTVVRVGIIVLFFGIAFLLKYAADNSLLPIELRLAGVALAATVLLALGWRIGERRQNQQAYGLVLQGGGVGALYLTVFAATRLYHLLPVAASLPMMIAVCALSAFLAVRQNAAALAFMGSAGGFLAPLLLSTGGGSHVLLFGYYALLNAGILAIAWFKAWRPLNLLGFVFTFSIGVLWGVTAYRPELFASTEPFLILFFLMYVGIALLYAVQRELALRHYVDGTLMFGTPLVVIGLQAALMKGTEFGLAWSAVAFAAFYLAIAAWLRRDRARLQLLFEATLALAIIFATLAVPLAFTGPTTSATWAIEGAAIVWLGVRQRRLVAFGFGVLMQLGAAGAFVVGMVLPSGDAAALPVLNSAYIATVLIGVAGMFTGWRLHGRSEARAWYPWMPALGAAAALWGLLWWIGGALNEIDVYTSRHVTGDRAHAQIAAVALFALLTAWLAHGAARMLRWPLAQWPALALAPCLAWMTIGLYALNSAPLAGYGWLAAALVAVGAYVLLWRQEQDASERVLAPLHTLMFWTVGALAALEGFWGLRAYVPEGAWSWSAWAYGFGVLLLLLAGVGQRLRWPVARYLRAYQLWAAAPLAALLLVWSVASVTSDGSAAPLVWLPLVNPLDVAQMLVFVACAVWLRRVRELDVRWPSRAFEGVMLATLFLWFNALLLRTLHHGYDVPYRLDALSHSMLVQASVSVFWTLCALATMIWATRRARRFVWFAGGGLLAATVIKLFLFDLSHVTGIERIVSFIGIGVMLLLVGYFSPLPPKLAVLEVEQ